jgi:predicted DNA-binding transcriptional regulator AlpA
MSTDQRTAPAATSTAALHTSNATVTGPLGVPGPATAAEPVNQVWTVEAVRALGMTTDAAILGFGRTKAYELAKNNRFPVQTLRIGRRYLVPVSAILRLLDAD